MFRLLIIAASALLVVQTLNEERHCASEVLNGVTFIAKCKFNGTETPCDGIIRPNTQAIITCSFGYKRSSSAASEIISCTESGEWDYHPVSCEPECGKITGTIPLISGEVESNASNVPWHATIYFYSDIYRKYEQICGGTIYSAKLVISGHCASEVLNGVTFRARCRFNGTEIPCDGKIRPNTRVFISCSFGYKRSLSAISEIIRCTETGKWDYLPVSCEPECGKITGSTPLISGEVESNASNVPWHATIYSNRNGKYEQICGGTIYSAKLVISAAHCFWDESYEEAKSVALYQVVVGKFFRSYDTIERRPRTTQFFNITEIHIPRSYNGAIGSYQNDIAILILSDFIKYKHNVQPICIKWLQFSERDVNPGTRGHLAAWGILSLDERNSSENLRVFDQDTYSNAVCLEKSPSSKSLITAEKFCVGYPKDKAVDPAFLICLGDTGGGYVAPNNDGESSTHYLLGVFSLILGSKCNGDVLTLFTNVLHYKDMITANELRNRPK